MEQRTEKRLNHCLELAFGNQEASTTGWTRNISRHGMLLSSESLVIPVKNGIQVSLKIGGDTIALNGVICWNNEFQEAWVLPEKQMGLFINEPPPKYCDYISRLG
ncbi:MAG: PilZ domain-containing protein [Chrysiogenales bacterium]